MGVQLPPRAREEGFGFRVGTPSESPGQVLLAGTFCVPRGAIWLGDGAGPASRRRTGVKSRRAGSGRMTLTRRSSGRPCSERELSMHPRRDGPPWRPDPGHEVAGLLRQPPLALAATLHEKPGACANSEDGVPWPQPMELSGGATPRPSAVVAWPRGGAVESPASERCNTARHADRRGAGGSPSSLHALLVCRRGPGVSDDPVRVCLTLPGLSSCARPEHFVVSGELAPSRPSARFRR